MPKGRAAAKKVSCDECYFRCNLLCALNLDEPCATFRPDHPDGLRPPRQLRFTFRQERRTPAAPVVRGTTLGRRIQEHRQPERSDARSDRNGGTSCSLSVGGRTDPEARSPVFFGGARTTRTFRHRWS